MIDLNYYLVENVSINIVLKPRKAFAQAHKSKPLARKMYK